MFIRYGSVLLLVSLCATQTGCLTLSSMMGRKKGPTLDTSMLEAQGYSIPRGGMPSKVQPSSDGKPRVVLEMRGDGRHMESIPLPADRAMFIEDLIQQSGLHEKIGACSISIMRPNGNQAAPLRLDCRTGENGKADNVGQNYALLPGDHVIVYSDQRTMLEKFVDRQF